MGFWGVAAPLLGGALGGGFDYLAAEKMAREQSRDRQHMDQVNAANYALQKEFAQHGIRWRVEDAKAAGIHPLAALGASMLGGSPSFSMEGRSFYPKADFLSKMGQNVSRAINATSTADERAFRALQIESMEIDNQIKRKQLDGMNNPPFPDFNVGYPPGSNQGGSNYGQFANPERPAQTSGYQPDVSYTRGDRVAYPVIPTALSESYEDDFIGKILWRIRNQLLPNINPWAQRPPEKDLPKGYDMWRWHYSQGWTPVKVPDWLKPRLRRTQERMGQKRHFER